MLKSHQSIGQPAVLLVAFSSMILGGPRPHDFLSRTQRSSVMTELCAITVAITCLCHHAGNCTAATAAIATVLSFVCLSASHTGSLHA